MTARNNIGSSQFIGSSLVSVTTLPQIPELPGEGLKFGQLILRRILKIVVTKSHDFKAKMHQN